MPHRRQKRVGPTEDDVTRIEIRPSRFFRILHVNARPRDQKFEHEMQMYIQYRSKGIPASGPLTMSRRQHSTVQQNSQAPVFKQQTHPNSACMPEDASDSKTENENVEMAIEASEPTQPLSNQMTLSAKEDPANSLSSSTFSSPAHQSVSEKVRSASSVLLAMRNQKQEQHDEYKTTLKKTHANIPNDITETEQGHQAKLPLDLSQLNSHSAENANSSGNESKSCHSPLSPPTESTKANDASLYPDLFTKTLNSAVSDIAQLPSQDRPGQSDQNNTHVDKDLALFFIHGVGGSADIWCAQTNHFGNLGYEVLAPDLIGHGFSSTPKEKKAYHFKEIAADLEEIFDRYCKRRNVIIGHSYGASFATLLARSRPRRVIKLILISGGPPTPLAPQPGVFSLPYCMLKCLKPCLICGFYKGAFYDRRTPVISKEEAFDIPAYALQHTMNGQDWPDGDELYHNWLTCPSLLIYGDKDQLVSLKEEQAMVEAIFDCRLEVIKDASHMVMIEAPEEVNQLIADFIKQPSDMYSSPAKNNNAAQPDTPKPPPPGRSKSRKSLKSAKSQHSIPNHLLSISIIG